MREVDLYGNLQAARCEHTARSNVRVPAVAIWIPVIGPGSSGMIASAGVRLRCRAFFAYRLSGGKQFGDLCSCRIGVAQCLSPCFSALAASFALDAAADGFCCRALLVRTPRRVCKNARFMTCSGLQKSRASTAKAPRRTVESHRKRRSKSSKAPELFQACSRHRRFQKGETQWR